MPRAKAKYGACLFEKNSEATDLSVEEPQSFAESRLTPLELLHMVIVPIEDVQAPHLHAWLILYSTYAEGSSYYQTSRVTLNLSASK